MKRLSALLSAIALLTGIFTPVTAANLPEPLFYDVFDGYVTHQKPTQGTYISRRVYTGVEEEKQNKMLVADVDGNGKTNSTDARLILQYTVGKIDQFPEA